MWVFSPDKDLSRPRLRLNMIGYATLIPNKIFQSVIVVAVSTTTTGEAAAAVCSAAAGM